MNWAMLIALLGSFGIGSVITSIVTNYLARRSSSNDRWYQEKRDAYLGLLTALHDAAVKPSNEASKAFGLWKAKCDVFGSNEVSYWVKQIADSDGQSSERENAFAALLKAMRADLR